MRRLLCLAILAFPLNLLAAPAVTACEITGPAPSRPPITGIAFTSFYVHDEAAAAHFYKDELGLRAIAGPAQTTVYPVNSRQWIETQPAGATARNSMQAAVGFSTPDLPAMQKYLALKGFGSTRGVQTKKGCEPVAQNGRFTVQDPEGNSIVFVQAGSEATVAHSTPSPSAISKRLIHAGFVVRDQAAENTFYADVLGFKPYWHGGMHDGTSDWVSLQVPDGTDWVEYMLNIKPDASANTRGVMNHVSLGVEKMDTAIAQLKANGCDTAECTASKMGRDGKVQLNLYDPDHTRVEVMEFAPSGPVCCSPITGRTPTETPL